MLINDLKIIIKNKDIKPKAHTPTRTLHFMKNPKKGGMPIKVIITIIIVGESWGPQFLDLVMCLRIKGNKVIIKHAKSKVYSEK
jgi:hypothetical protein